MKKNILLVDDEPSWLKSVSQLLRRKGYQVKEAASAAEALVTLAKYKPDLIVSDLRMPDMNGFDFLEKVKKLPKMSMTPVVFLSAIDDFHAKKVAKELGAVACIPKPFNKDEVIPTLEKYLPH
ncbi:MAG TPA: hypothetical protein DCP63_03930 [Bacteroidetes bacterium]|nr:hypothetical protein [Bacteroidota bacterium]